MGYTAIAEWGLLRVEGATVLLAKGVSVLGGLLLVDDDGSLSVLTGINTGPVSVNVEIMVSPPPAAEAAWEDVAEISCRPNLRQQGLSGCFVHGPSEIISDEAFALNPASQSDFRVRVHARNRDRAFDRIATVPHEEYLLQSWPARPAPPTLIRATSSTARWRQGGGL